MDASETHVAAYLKTCGFTDIRYEPDGNVPPDFLCDERVAVEVRRLNQHHDDGTGPKGLEELAIPLWQRVRELILSLGPPTRDESWYVFYRFSRPVPKWRLIRLRIERLAAFMKAADPEPFDRKICDGFELKVFRAPVKPTFFVPAGHIDEETAGWLIGNIEDNLKICIAEKTEKIRKVRAKYREWWLVLPDHIGFGLDDFDRERFRDQVKLAHDFDRVVLLDPRDHSRAFVI
jgi:hypothetical protein